MCPEPAGRQAAVAAYARAAVSGAAAQRPAATSSAIWTVLSAAPLRRLSLLTNSASPRPSATPGSCRMPADVARVLAGRLQRRRDVEQLDPGRGGQQLAGPLDRERPGELDVQRQRVAGEDRHAHAGARDQQVRDAEDLAALVAELLLLVGLERAVVDDRAGHRQHVERDRARRTSPARGTCTADPSWASSAALSTTAAPARRAPRRRPARCRRPPGRCWRRSGRRPASSCSGSSTGIAAIVVQFGLAMMPLRTSASACGLTSLTTSGTSGSIRQAEQLSMTITPAAANRGASAFEVAPPAENIAMSSPDGVGAWRRPRR